jgi:hypothetical protein
LEPALKIEKSLRGVRWVNDDQLLTSDEAQSCRVLRNVALSDHHDSQSGHACSADFLINQLAVRSSLRQKDYACRTSPYGRQELVGQVLAWLRMIFSQVDSARRRLFKGLFGLRYKLVVVTTVAHEDLRG